MNLKLRDYHISYRKDLKRQLESRPNTDPYAIVAEVSCLTGCHIIALLYHLIDLKGDSPEIREKIEGLRKFYLIDSIIE